MRYFFLVFKFFCCLMLMSSCIEEIEFDVPRDFQNSTVIMGKLVKGNPSTIEVSIQNLFDFSFEDVIYVRAQSVRLINEIGQNLEIPVSGVGVYSLDIYPNSGFEVEAGGLFYVEVDLFNGRSFISKPVKLLSVPNIKNIEFSSFERETITFRDKKEIQPWIEYFVSSDLNSSQSNEPVNLKWEFQRTYKQTDNGGKSCYITREVSFDLISLVNTKLLNTPSLVRFPAHEQIISSTMVEGQYVNVIQEALNDETFKFWKDVKELSTNSGTFYEPPAGKLITNFETSDNTEGSVFGYFYATEQDTLNVLVSTPYINQFRKVCPKSFHINGQCDDCCDCESVPNSTTKKPSYWVD